MPGRKNELILSENPVLAQAQVLMSRQDYIAFLDLADRELDRLEGEDQGELYLMRAQIKTFYSDETLLDDYKAARRLLPSGSTIATMGTRFATNAPSVLTVFYPEGGSLSGYKLALRKARPSIQRLCGAPAVALADILESEVLYHAGYFNRAIDMGKTVYEWAVEAGNGYIAIPAGYLLIRAYIATGEPEKMEEIMAQMIRYSRVYSRPYYREMYNTVRNWLNCTTGWMGETPRYHIPPSGEEIPVLDDRISVMNSGMAELCAYENGVLLAARSRNPSAYCLKDLYANLYEAMVMFKLGNHTRAVNLFYEMYSITQKNRLLMPFAEYGTQILPLLQYALTRKDTLSFARRWSDKVNQMATQYEECLRIVRGEADASVAPIVDLPPVEKKILRMMTENLTIAEISEVLDFHISDTKEYIRNIYRIMGVHNRPEAVARARGSRIFELVDVEL